MPYNVHQTQKKPFYGEVGAGIVLEIIFKRSKISRLLWKKILSTRMPDMPWIM
jgi:hypothetical protein